MTLRLKLNEQSSSTGEHE
jgi:hypothetical protein